ncbi:MAG: glycosyltransferase family 9 protein [Vampirovibrionales bacterium]|nr:glycosyltransferase family 9 protein [Vampirovibrionales bacterium]
MMQFAHQLIQKQAVRRHSDAETRIETGPQRIGFIHTGWLGDHFLFSPVIRAVRAVFPKAHLTLFTTRRYETVQAVLTGLDEVVFIDAPRRQTALSLWRLLTSARLDALLVNYEFELPAKALSLAMAFSGIPHRIGCSRNWLRRLALNAPLQNRLDEQNVYLCDVFYELAQTLFARMGATPPADGVKAFRHAPQACIPTFVRSPQAGYSPRLLIHPGTSAGSKTQNWPKSWPPEHWAEFIRQFLKRYPRGSVCLTGGPDDREEVARIEQALTAYPDVARERFINLFGQVTSVADLAALMQTCDVFAGCDSFAMHLALYAGLPMVAIFGMTSEKRFLPHPSDSPVPFRIAARDELTCRPCLCITREEACERPICLQTPVSTVLGHIEALVQDAQQAVSA